jgi:hypothetical protein
MTWWMWAGSAAWVVGGLVVAIVVGRAIAIADRAARPESAVDASERPGGPLIPETTRPDGSGRIRRQNGASL